MMTIPPTPPLHPLYAALRIARFYSRLPLPTLKGDADPHGMPDFSRNLWAVPLIGAVLGGIGALVGLAALRIGLPPFIVATLLLTTGIIITGAFHEDGLADSCDGLWGGMTKERRLDIMRDSRIGTYGAAALVLALLLRVGAWAEMFRLLGPLALWLAPGIGALSRILALLPMYFLPPARADGVAGQTARPNGSSLLLALVLGSLMMAGTANLAGLFFGLAYAAPSLVLTLSLAIFIMQIKISGHSGDVLGASQQVLEIALLLSLTAFAVRIGPI